MATATLDENDVVRAFHAITRSALAHARVEGLLTDDELETADVDVQVAGPALALFFAALSARGFPPEITSPDGSFALTTSNCPAPFANAFKLWQTSVPKIQSFSSDARHDLALVLCDKPAESSPLRVDVARTGADLKGIALEILQRRTFQDRFQADLQAALDSARPRRSGESQRARPKYEPPPMYSKGEPTEETKRAYGHVASSGYRDSADGNAGFAAIEQQGMENLSLIRETLYSALADVLVKTPSIRQMLSSGPEWSAKAFFAATCLAIVEVALSRIDRHGVRAVDLGRTSTKVIGLKETPTHLRPFLSRLIEVSQALRALADADDARAVQEGTEGVEQLTPPKLDRLKERLAKGIGAEETLSSARSSVDGEVAGLANAINTLALGMSALPAFRERQAQAFQILVSVTSL